MFNHCQPILINNLYGLLTINTTENSLCLKSRQWYFFYDYGYTLLIRLINIAHLLTNSYVFKIYSILNKQKILVYDSTNQTIVNNQIQFDLNNENSPILFELISIKNSNLSHTSFIIDYVFRETSQSYSGRKLLQDNSSSSSFNSSQPAFIALICIIVLLVLAIIIAIIILCYRHYSHRNHSKKRHKKLGKKSRRKSTDERHLATSITPTSTSSYSIQSSSQQLFNKPYASETTQQTSSLAHNLNTVPTMVPSRRLQQSMIDAYINDLNSMQPNRLDPKQLNSYLFVDLHSTSSETYPDINKKPVHDNTTTSGYDTSTGGEEKYEKNSSHHRRRRRRFQHHNQRQRYRSALTFKRANGGARFLMRERSLPNNLQRLPQLRQKNPFFNLRDNNSSTTTSSNNNQDLTSTNLSSTTDDYDETYAYHVNRTPLMDTIDEEKPATIATTTPPPHKPCFFEMVSTHRGDDSDMPNYEDLPIRYKSATSIGNGIAYVNDSIIV